MLKWILYIVYNYSILVYKFSVSKCQTLKQNYMNVYVSSYENVSICTLFWQRSMFASKSQKSYFDASMTSIVLSIDLYLYLFQLQCQKYICMETRTIHIKIIHSRSVKTQENWVEHSILLYPYMKIYRIVWTSLSH